MALDYVVLVVVLLKLTKKGEKEIFLACDEGRQILAHGDDILMAVVDLNEIVTMNCHHIF